MSSSSTTPRHSSRTTAADASARLAAVVAAVTAPTSSPPDQAAAVPSSDDSVGYNPTAEELQADAADEAKEDNEHGTTGSSGATMRVMDPRSVSVAQVHEFHRRSLLPMDDPDWCDPTGGIPPRDEDGKIPSQYKEMIELMFYELYKRQEGTDLALVKAVEEGAAASLATHQGEWFQVHYSSKSGIQFVEEPPQGRVLEVLKEILKWLKRIGHDLAPTCGQLIEAGFAVPMNDSRKTGPTRMALYNIFWAAGLICSGLLERSTGKVDLSLGRARKLAELDDDDKPVCTFAIKFNRNAKMIKDQVAILDVVVGDRMPAILERHLEKVAGNKVPFATSNKAARLLEELGPDDIKGSIAAWKKAGCQDVLLVDLAVSSGTFKMQ
ncbi:hypothetical protein BCR44DRAFT_27056 [Catenaria anguillulae PL171]|uniref:Uncharacterized protein n=1 Tax=Catenaria anguillulae PL171 TaxID=765915 RepID=A0A1Y2HT15_9FUNG|nr:hypothetical protein BCR44DRAFT_27056 [Catenaria anguillulae PL171]